MHFMAVIVSLPAASASDDRAIALLRGVEQARLGLPAGQLTLTINGERLSQKKSETMKLSISYDGERRTAFQKSEILIIPPANQEKHKQIAQMPQKEAVEKGFGKLKDQEIRNAWAGKSYINYWEGSSTAMSKAIANGPSQFVFDPRTLGISSDLSAAYPVAFYLGFENCRDAKVVGQEEINGFKTWHVVVDTAVGTRVDFWIEDAPGFRVHRHFWDLRVAPITVLCESFFMENDHTSILPNKIKVQRYDKDGKVSTTTTITVDHVEFGPQSPAPGSLASLKPPVGTAVVDDQTGQTLGFWDGQELVKELKQKGPSVPTATEPKVTPIQWTLWLSVAAGVIIFGVSLVWLVRRRYRLTN